MTPGEQPLGWAADPQPPKMSPLSPRHRTVLIASVAVVADADLVAVLLGVLRPAPQQQAASLPGGACTTVSAATLDTYVSGTARAVPGPAAGGRREQESCSWSGLAGAQTRFLYVRITVYRSATAAADARAAFAAAPLSDENCRCQGRTQALPELGDQAKTTFLAEDVDLPVQADMTGYPPDAGAYVLVVRSGNAIVNLAYQAAADAVTTRALCPIFWAGDAEVVLNLNYRGPAAPPRAARLAHAVAIARSILGVLDHPPKPWVPANALDV